MIKEQIPGQIEKNTAYYLDLLGAESKKVTEQIERFKAEADDQAVSGDDRATVQQEREKRGESINNAEERLREIKRAISWIEKNGYICAVCKKEIESDRVEADPASITCKEHRNEEDSIEID